jgi:protein gp37
MKDGKWWTDSWNVVTGCTPVSEACDHCWAQGMVRRFPLLHGMVESPGPDYPLPFHRVKLHPERLDAPLHWRKPRRVFVCSLGDLFHEQINIQGPEIREIFRVMACTDHTYFLLTKRVRRMAACIDALNGPDFAELFPNVWCGVTVEHPDYVWRIEELIKIPAAKRFVSIEPMLSAIDMRPYLQMLWLGLGEEQPMLDWVVAGSESGPGRRPSKIEWFIDLKNQCVDTDTPFYLKQLEINGKVVKAPELEGRQWLEMP